MTLIHSAGHFIPDDIITNQHLADRFPTEFDLPEWIVSKTGISERRETGMLPSAQGIAAAKHAIEQYTGKIDFIIVNTFFGDYTMPLTATLIQKGLGLTDAFAFEINMPCAGPIYTLSIADMFLKSGKYKTGLLIGVDKIRDLIDPQDYLMNALFGEGAGALIVSNDASTGKGVIDFYLGSTVDGDEGEENYSLKVLAGRARFPIQQYDNEKTDHYLIMNGREVKHFIVQKIDEAVLWMLNKHVKTVEEIDYVVTHQANRLILEKCLMKHGIAKEKLLTTAEYLGNTASASIFLTMSVHFEKFREPNKNILICGMGGGLTWGAIFYRT